MPLITPKFLFAPDHEKSELYILHRQYPACLIHVIQTTPITFLIVDLYDKIPQNKLLKHPFLEEAKTFFREYGQNILYKN